MKWNFRRYEFCPGEAALDLLRAALDPDLDEAHLAWRRWRAANSLEDCELKMHRLMPLIYRRFQSGGLSQSDHKLLRGVYRYNWTRNQFALRQAQIVVNHLQLNGIPVILLKGLPLILQTYGDLGVRPMWDFDVLISPDHQRKAVSLLAEIEWDNSLPCPPPSANHAHELVSPQGRSLDLHWYAAYACRWTAADSDFWQHSVELGLTAPGASQSKVMTRCLCPEHNLLHVCMHGARKNSGQDVGWVCDVCQILARHPMDWDLVIAGAQHHRVVLTLSLALTYLATHVGAPVPSSVLEKLQKIPVSWPDRIYFELEVRGGVLPVLGMPTFEYLRLEARPSLGGFFEFLRHRWGLSHWTELPFAAVSRIGRRVYRLMAEQKSERPDQSDSQYRSHG